MLFSSQIAKYCQATFKFQHTDLPQMCWDSSYCGVNVSLSSNNMIATKTSGGSYWNGTVLSNSTVTSFTIRILNRGSDRGMMIGMAPKPSFKIGSSNCSTCGYYLNVNDGCLYSQQGDSGKAYSSPVRTGRTIEVVFDQNTRTISFRVLEMCELIHYL